MSNHYNDTAGKAGRFCVVGEYHWGEGEGTPPKYETILHTTSSCESFTNVLPIKMAYVCNKWPQQNADSTLMQHKHMLEI